MSNAWTEPIWVWEKWTVYLGVCDEQLSRGTVYVKISTRIICCDQLHL